MKDSILVLARCAAVRALFLGTLLLGSIARSDGATAEWRFAPEPNFSRAALKKATADEVRLHVVLAKDGSVTAATVSKSAGDSGIDRVARETVLKWKMNPAAVKPEDLTRGREQIIKIRQAPDFALRGDPMGQATYMPELEYPEEARRRGIKGSGIFLVRVNIKSGHVKKVFVWRSTGSAILDKAAVSSLSKAEFKPGVLPPIKETLPSLKDDFAEEDAVVAAQVSFPPEQ